MHQQDLHALAFALTLYNAAVMLLVALILWFALHAPQPMVQTLSDDHGRIAAITAPQFVEGGTAFTTGGTVVIP